MAQAKACGKPWHKPVGGSGDNIASGFHALNESSPGGVANMCTAIPTGWG